MSRLAWAATAVLTLITFALGLVAIWTHGPDAARWAGTAFASFVAALVAFATAVCMEDR